jgi:hypothetical protein
MTDITRIADLAASPIAYDDNITLAGYADRSETLPEDQYYVLLVTDTFNSGVRSERDYWKPQYAWVGLECTSRPERVYISKNFNRRHNGYRGIVLIVTVKEVSRCFILD